MYNTGAYAGSLAGSEGYGRVYLFLYLFVIWGLDTKFNDDIEWLALLHRSLSVCLCILLWWLLAALLPSLSKSLIRLLYRWTLSLVNRLLCSNGDSMFDWPGLNSDHDLVVAWHSMHTSVPIPDSGIAMCSFISNPIPNRGVGHAHRLIAFLKRYGQKLIIYASWYFPQPNRIMRLTKKLT